jgi:hypothetical protein
LRPPKTHILLTAASPGKAQIRREVSKLGWIDRHRLDSVIRLHPNFKVNSVAFRGYGNVHSEIRVDWRGAEIAEIEGSKHKIKVRLELAVTEINS